MYMCTLLNTSPLFVHLCMHTRAHIRTCTHEHTHTHIHTHTRVRARTTTHLHVHTRTHTHTYAHTHTHTHTRTHMHTHFNIMYYVCRWTATHFLLPPYSFQVSMASTYQPSVYSPTSAMSTMYTVPYYYK